MNDPWFYLLDKEKEDYLYVYGMLYECPFEKRLTTCPINDLKDLSFKEKLNWFENLDMDKKNILIKKHKACYSARSESFKKY